MTESPSSSQGRLMLRVAHVDDLPEGKLKLVRADHARIALVRIAGEVRAVSGLCTHARVFLAPGVLDQDGLIECPSHGAKFSPIDGSVHCAPATQPLAVFEVQVVGGSVYVDCGSPPAEGPDSATKPGARASAAQWGNWS